MLTRFATVLSIGIKRHKSITFGLGIIVRGMGDSRGKIQHKTALTGMFIVIVIQLADLTRLAYLGVNLGKTQESFGIISRILKMRAGITC